MDAYTIEHLSFSYPDGAQALRDVCLRVESGEWLTLCGRSGCGKTTLLRQLKSALAPHGARTGNIRFEGKPLEQWSEREQASRIGFVLQNPDNQIVTDKVWHELAFGLESLGIPSTAIRLRVAEMASFFGIQSWFYRDVAELSGGQKQLLNLAAVMAMQPSVLLLDEPTSQLDPIAAADFLATVSKINRDDGDSHRAPSGGDSTANRPHGGLGSGPGGRLGYASGGGGKPAGYETRDVLLHARAHADLRGREK